MTMKHHKHSLTDSYTIDHNKKENIETQQTLTDIPENITAGWKWHITLKRDPVIYFVVEEKPQCKKRKTIQKHFSFKRIAYRTSVQRQTTRPLAENHEVN